MLEGDHLAARLYDLFGPAPFKLLDSADRPLALGLAKRGAALSADSDGSICFCRLGYREEVPQHFPWDAKLDYWVFYCNDSAGVSRAELDDICIARGLERAPITAVAAPFDTLDKKGPWWAVYRRSKAEEPRDTALLSASGQAPLSRLALLRHLAAYVRAGDVVAMPGSSLEERGIVRELAEPCEVTSGTQAGLFEVILDVATADCDVAGLAAKLVPGGIVVTTRSARWKDTALRHEATCFQQTTPPRDFRPDAGDVEIALLRKSPLSPGNFGFRNAADTVFNPAVNGLDFGRSYQFPHVVRSVVNMQHRVRSVPELIRTCREILEVASPHSADAGAALCVLSYASDAYGFACADPRVEGYVFAKSSDPHVVRWQISLSYVMAESCLLAGRRDEAVRLFDRCASMDACAFHLSILTKQVAACYRLAAMAAADGQGELASTHLVRGTSLASKITAVEPDYVFGFGNDPRWFFYGEVAEALQTAGRCAYALEGWNRGGLKELRRAMAVSCHLFRAPPMVKELVAVNTTTQDDVERFAADMLSIKGTAVLAGKLIWRKIVRRLQSLRKGISL